MYSIFCVHSSRSSPNTCKVCNAFLFILANNDSLCCVHINWPLWWRCFPEWGRGWQHRDTSQLGEQRWKNWNSLSRSAEKKEEMWFQYTNTIISSYQHGPWNGWQAQRGHNNWAELCCRNGIISPPINEASQNNIPSFHHSMLRSMLKPSTCCVISKQTSCDAPVPCVLMTFLTKLLSNKLYLLWFHSVNSAMGSLRTPPTHLKTIPHMQAVSLL